MTQGASSLPTTFQSCRVQLSCHLAQEAGEEAGGALDPRACPHSLLRPTEVSWPSETHGVHGPVLWCVLGERDDHYTMETYSGVWTQAACGSVPVDREVSSVQTQAEGFPTLGEVSGLCQHIPLLQQNLS